MSYNLIIKEEADLDIITSYLWYEEQRIGLGEEFLEEIEEYLKIISINPYLYEIKYKEQRTAVIKRFPFVIVYEIEATEIIVYAVFHTSRNPKDKYRK